MKPLPTVSLGDVCQFVSGGTPSRKVPDYFRGTIPWITSSDLTSDVVTSAREYITEEAVAASATNVIPKGSLLLVTRTSVGKIAIAGADICISQDFTGIVPDTELIAPKYLFHFLRCKHEYFVSNQRGATIQGVTRDAVAELRLTLPAIPEQRHITAVLDRADRLRRLRRYALELGESYLQAVFLEMFGDGFVGNHACKRLGELVTITGGGTPSREVGQYFEGHIPWLTSKDMQGDYIFDTQEHITEQAIRESATKLVPANSILVVVKSKVLMHRLPVAIAKVPLCHGQDIKSIQCSDKVSPVFIVHTLKHNERRLLGQARGANTEGLTLPMLEEILVPDVLKHDQRRFTEIAMRHERIRAQQREALRQAEHLFQTLLHQAFQGEL